MSKKATSNTGEALYALAKQIVTMEQDKNVELAVVQKSQAELSQLIQGVLKDDFQDKQLDIAFTQAADKSETDVLICLQDYAVKSSQVYEHEDGSISHLVTVPFSQVGSNKKLKNPSYAEMQKIIRGALMEEGLINRPENFYLSNMSIDSEEASTQTIASWFNLLQIGALQSKQGILDLKKKVPTATEDDELEVLFLTGVVTQDKDEDVPIINYLKDTDLPEYTDRFNQYMLNELLPKYPGRKWALLPPICPDIGVILALEARDENVLTLFFETYAGRNDLTYILALLEGDEDKTTLVAFNSEGEIESQVFLRNFIYEMGEEDAFDYLLEKINFCEIDIINVMEDPLDLEFLYSDEFDLEEYREFNACYALENTEKSERTYLH